jgi:hypothetical protein
LFVKGYSKEAEKLLREAMQADIDETAQLEAQFYLLSHASENVLKVFQVIKDLLDRGARLNWDVEQNITVVRQDDPKRASLLTSVTEIMSGKEKVDKLVEISNHWLE